MQTSTQQPRARRGTSAKSTAAPFSPTAARLIEQIQAEAREQLLADLSAKDAIVVLHGFDPETKRVRVSGDMLTVHDRKGNAVEMHRCYAEPEGWKTVSYMQGYWHPAHWYGDQIYVDANGIGWKRDLGAHVCDDFGNLVQVAA